ncbi:virus protein of unknown function [Streptococcus equinus]|uniref:Capsid and scaffold protein n=1 Tax=Streptococcus equinus TaxID=1335 RepID=A0A1H0Y3W8_STREI|nr:DUF859 family phage minor structural protein [Streptococcus equinus]QBX24899.1 capsid and scaffold protein [Streptococcus phage Javan214]SDQ09857.1 virus protein of unknown function [Streptococcus equinus]
MATATFSGQYGHNMTLEVWSGWNKQDVANNRSTVNVQARLITNGYASMWGVTADLTITINGGSAIEHPGINIGTGSSQLIFAHDYVVGHNNDGSKTVGIKISVNLNTGGYGSSMVAFDLKLPNIPRASSGSVTSGDLGTPVKISIDRKVSAFKHTLRYDWNGVTGTIASNVDTSYSWTLPMSFADKIPNATSSWGRIFIDTYNGSTKIGTKEATFTGNVPASVKPTLGSITLDDTNTNVKNLINTSNTFVQVLSNPKVTFNNAKGSYSSTISNYHAEIVGKNQAITSNGESFGMLNYSGEVTIRATVTDSRGRTSDPVEVKANVLAYFTPQLSFTAQRSGSSGTTVTVTRNAKIAPLTVGDKQKNTMKLVFKYKKHSDTTFTADTGSAGGTWATVSTLTNSQANLGATFSSLTSYDIVGTISDSFTSYDFSATVGTETYPLALRPDSVGLGKTPENKGVDSAWQYFYNNKPIQHHQVTINDGQAILLAKGTDLNTIVHTGFYRGDGLVNKPSGSGAHTWTWIKVSKHDSWGSWVLQEAIDFNGKVSAFRVKKNEQGWTAWQYNAIQNTVAEFTAVNQTKVYSATLAGPYGLALQARRVGNLVSVTLDAAISSTDSRAGTANETIPVGWRPCKTEVIISAGFAGGGTGTQMWTGESFCRLFYYSNGKIDFTIRASAKPLGVYASVTWITTDPFPS